MSPADLIQELRDKHDAWQRQCDGWIANAESLGGGIDAATIERMRRTVYGEAADALASKDTALAEIRAENERLRAALALSDQPCAYCSLPVEEWNKCQHGFPGCDRSDDAMGCRELGASLRLAAAESELARIKKALEPFARRAFFYDGQDDDWFCSPSVQVKHLRAARLLCPILDEEIEP